ncbi:MAG TPA: molybdate ABC transporter substrate-binding protein [Candidatus Acidoferrales bacterium]|nr:molybdate ABC transporter substrate-binding protein [Candidatus Acidoferrales bacterium]
MRKRIRTIVALAVLAGLALVTPFLAARPGHAASLPQAASDLTDARNEIAANFEKATGCTVRLRMGSSGNVLTQLENGAPVDVFLSADIAYPKKLEAEGPAAPGSTYLYATGKIVVWTPKDSHVDVGKGFSALRDPLVQKSAVANPAHAPYGRAAEEALRKAGVYDAEMDRLVLGQNISQAAEFVESGNADAGILALSRVVSPAMKDKGYAWNIPENLYMPIQQGAVRAAANPEGARQFIDSIQLPATAAVFTRYGFTLPTKSSTVGKP